MGGTKQFPKNEIEGYLAFHNLFVRGIQNLLFSFKIKFQDFLDFLHIKCHQWNGTSKWCMWKGCIQRSHSDVQSSRKVHLYSVPSNFFSMVGLVLSFPVLKFFELLWSLLVFFPVWGSRHFLNSVTSNQRERTGTHDHFPQWNVTLSVVF